METYYVQTSVSAYGSNVGFNMGVNWNGLKNATKDTWVGDWAKSVEGVPGIKQVQSVLGGPLFGTVGGSKEDTAKNGYSEKDIGELLGLGYEAIKLREYYSSEEYIRVQQLNKAVDAITRAWAIVSGAVGDGVKYLQENVKTTTANKVIEKTQENQRKAVGNFWLPSMTTENYPGFAAALPSKNSFLNWDEELAKSVSQMEADAIRRWIQEKEYEEFVRKADASIENCSVDNRVKAGYPSVEDLKKNPELTGGLNANFEMVKRMQGKTINGYRAHWGRNKQLNWLSGDNFTDMRGIWDINKQAYISIDEARALMNSEANPQITKMFNKTIERVAAGEIGSAASVSEMFNNAIYPSKVEHYQLCRNVAEVDKIMKDGFTYAPFATLKAMVNAGVSTVVSTATLGWFDNVELWSVTDQERMYYNVSYAINRGTYEVVTGFWTGSLASTGSRVGQAFRFLDAGQNLVNTGRGGYSMWNDGVGFGNSIQLGSSLLSLYGNFPGKTKNSGLFRKTGARELKNYDFDGAEAIYGTIRKSSDDITVIARNTGMKDFQIQRIKNHLFYKSHVLDDGIRLFDADPAIANSWLRLQEGTHGATDIQLLRHELFESKFEGIFRTDYRTAHDAANRAGRLSGLE